MKTRKSHSPRPSKIVVSVPAERVEEVIEETIKESKSKVSPAKLWIALVVVLAATALCFMDSLGYEFTNWDDEMYVHKNTVIQKLDAEHIKKMFTETYFANYQPITLLSYAIDYHLYELDPYGYHLTSYVLHIINTALVFAFVWLLTGSFEITLISAFLFGVHTLHVESVCWMADRKDLLLCLFYVSALITYLFYIRSQKLAYLACTIILFVLAVLSKSVAITLPIVMLLMDYYLARKFDKKVFFEKAPLLLLSIATGLLSVKMQKDADATNDILNYTLVDRLLFVNYNFVQYISKLFAPLNLSAYYGFPEKVKGSLPLDMWMYPAIAVVGAGVFVFLFRKNKEAWFAALFYAITISLSLQFIPVGVAIMADRFAYVPSIGFCLGVGFSYLALSRKGKPFEIAAQLIVIVYLAWVVLLTLQREKSWKNSLVLWNDVLGKNSRLPVAFHNRAITYHQKKEYESALQDYNSALALSPTIANLYADRGSALFNLKRFPEALTDLDQALSMKQDHNDARYNRGNTLKELARYDSAIADFSTYLIAKPGNADALNSRGLCYAALGKHELAIADYDAAVASRPDYAEALYNKGILYGNIGQGDQAIVCYNQAIAANPKLTQSYNNRAIEYGKQQKLDQTIADFSKVIELEPKDGQAYFNRGITYNMQGRKAEACADIRKAVELNYEVAIPALRDLCK